MDEHTPIVSAKSGRVVPGVQAGETASWAETYSLAYRLVTLGRVAEAREVMQILRKRDPHSLQLARLEEQHPCLKGPPAAA
jgi:hypothetical protein